MSFGFQQRAALQLPPPDSDVNGPEDFLIRRIPTTAPVVIVSALNYMPLNIDCITESSSSPHAAITKIMFSRIISMNSISCDEVARMRLLVAGGRPTWGPMPGQSGICAQEQSGEGQIMDACAKRRHLFLAWKCVHATIWVRSMYYRRQTTTGVRVSCSCRLCELRA